MSMLIMQGDKSEESIGGKAQNLLCLHNLGYKTAPFIIIPYTYFEDLISKEYGSSGDHADFISMHLPDSLLEEISSVLDPDSLFAVRSSFPEEDSENYSYAGQFKTRLCVPFNQLEEAIIDVLSSVFSNNVLEYQKTHQLRSYSFLSVVVQQMIYPEVSGVAFGINPVTGNRKQKVISAVYGLGEGLVSGKLDADKYIVDSDSIEESIVKKPRKIVFDANSSEGITEVDVEQHKVGSPALNRKQIKEVCNLLDNLKHQLGKYQDVEFAFERGELIVLQTRPVTTFQNLPDISDKYIVWDNSNIIESYPGITLPLTFSFIIKLYDQAYRQFVGLMGVSKKEIDKNANHFANMLGFLNGRIYYNLRSWYQMISMLPGYSLNSGFMEQMMGVKERFYYERQAAKNKTRELIRIFFMGVSIIKNLITLERQKHRFVVFFNSMENEYNRLDIETFSTHDLIELYKKQESQMLQHWKAPLVNDFFAMIYFGLLRKTTIKLFGDQSTLHNDLLFGIKTIITTRPAEIIHQIVSDIYNNPEYKALFKDKTPCEILFNINNEEQYTLLKDKVHEYINEFGDRQVGELKLETQTYKQFPELFIKVLQSYILSDKQPSIKFGESENNIRKEAEKKIRKRLKGRPIKRLYVKQIIKKTRSMVSGRENLRLYRTRAFGFSRQVFTQLGQIFYTENLIKQPEDIFLLTKDEIFDYIKGTSVNYNLKDLIGIRKEQFEKFKKEPVQNERIKTHGIAYLGNSFFAKEKITKSVSGLKGIGCCRGVVKGKVRIIQNPEDAFNIEGDILVTTTTDPGWVTIFPSISGILVERGSLLSHAAIVSREMGIPCIVGIQDLTNVLKSGDYIEMDGEQGIVNIIESVEHDK